MAFEVLNVVPAPGSQMGPSERISFDIRSDESMGQLAVAVRYARSPRSELAFAGMPAVGVTFEPSFAESSSVSPVAPGEGFIERWHFELQRSPKWIGSPTVTISWEGGGIGPMGPPGPPGPPGPSGPMGPAGTAPSGATQDEPGRLSCTIYVHPASARVGTNHIGALVQAAPVQWTSAADIPVGSWFRLTVFGGGGGGGGGTVAISRDGIIRGGGGGGGGARHPPIVLSRADLVSALPIFFIAGIGGEGGSGAARSGYGITNGLSGLPGGQSEVSGNGLYLSAGAGFSGGSSAGGAGGSIFTSATVSAGGLPDDSFLFNAPGRLFINGGGSQHVRRTDGGGGTYYYCINGGASGGGYQNSLYTYTYYGMKSAFGGAGGGHGGTATSHSYGQSRSAIPGTAGGDHDILNGTVGGAGAAAGSQPVGHGNAGRDGMSSTVGGEGGGGGGSYSGNALEPPPPPAGGNGGAGGFPAGGGAGGGSLNHGRNDTPLIGGRGGNGGDGCIIIDAFA